MSASSSQPKQKQDKRVVRTKAAIHQAFFDLLGETDYSNITITAIAQRAMVGRKTFYKHYSSVSDLLSEIARSQIDLAVETIQAPDEILDIPEALEQFTVAALRVLRNYPGLDENLMRSLPTSALLELTKEPLAEAFSRELEKRGLERIHYYDYWVSCYIGGICSVFETWSSAGGTDDDLDEIAHLVGKSMGDGLGSLLAAHYDEVTLD